MKQEEGSEEEEADLKHSKSQKLENQIYVETTPTQTPWSQELCMQLVNHHVNFMKQ